MDKRKINKPDKANLNALRDLLQQDDVELLIAPKIPQQSLKKWSELSQEEIHRLGEGEVEYYVLSTRDLKNGKYEKLFSKGFSHTYGLESEDDNPTEQEDELLHVTRLRGNFVDYLSLALDGLNAESSIDAKEALKHFTDPARDDVTAENEQQRKELRGKFREHLEQVLKITRENLISYGHGNHAYSNILPLFSEDLLQDTTIITTRMQYGSEYRPAMLLKVSPNGNYRKLYEVVRDIFNSKNALPHQLSVVPPIGPDDEGNFYITVRNVSDDLVEIIEENYYDYVEQDDKLYDSPFHLVSAYSTTLEEHPEIALDPSHLKQEKEKENKELTQEEIYALLAAEGAQLVLNKDFDGNYSSMRVELQNAPSDGEKVHLKRKAYARKFTEIITKLDEALLGKRIDPIHVPYKGRDGKMNFSVSLSHGAIEKYSKAFAENIAAQSVITHRFTLNNYPENGIIQNTLDLFIRHEDIPGTEYDTVHVDEYPAAVHCAMAPVLDGEKKKLMIAIGWPYKVGQEEVLTSEQKSSLRGSLRLPSDSKLMLDKEKSTNSRSVLTIDLSDDTFDSLCEQFKRQKNPMTAEAFLQLPQVAAIAAINENIPLEQAKFYNPGNRRHKEIYARDPEQRKASPVKGQRDDMEWVKTGERKVRIKGKIEIREIYGWRRKRKPAPEKKAPEVVPEKPKGKPFTQELKDYLGIGRSIVADAEECHIIDREQSSVSKIILGEHDTDYQLNLALTPEDYEALRDNLRRHKPIAEGFTLDLHPTIKHHKGTLKPGQPCVPCSIAITEELYKSLSDAGIAEFTPDKQKLSDAASDPYETTSYEFANQSNVKKHVTLRAEDQGRDRIDLVELLENACTGKQDGVSKKKRGAVLTYARYESLEALQRKLDKQKEILLRLSSPERMHELGQVEQLAESEEISASTAMFMDASHSNTIYSQKDERRRTEKLIAKTKALINDYERVIETLSPYAPEDHSQEIILPVLMVNNRNAVSTGKNGDYTKIKKCIENPSVLVLDDACEPHRDELGILLHGRRTIEKIIENSGSRDRIEHENVNSGFFVLTPKLNEILRERIGKTHPEVLSEEPVHIEDFHSSLFRKIFYSSEQDIVEAKEAPNTAKDLLYKNASSMLVAYHAVQQEGATTIKSPKPPKLGRVQKQIHTRPVNASDRGSQPVVYLHVTDETLSGAINSIRPKEAAKIIAALTQSGFAKGKKHYNELMEQEDPLLQKVLELYAQHVEPLQDALYAMDSSRTHAERVLQELKKPGILSDEDRAFYIGGFGGNPFGLISEHGGLNYLREHADTIGISADSIDRVRASLIKWNEEGVISEQDKAEAITFLQSLPVLQTKLAQRERLKARLEDYADTLAEAAGVPSQAVIDLLASEKYQIHSLKDFSKVVDHSDDRRIFKATYHSKETVQVVGPQTDQSPDACNIATDETLLAALKERVAASDGKGIVIKIHLDEESKEPLALDELRMQRAKDFTNAAMGKRYAEDRGMRLAGTALNKTFEHACPAQEIEALITSLCGITMTQKDGVGGGK